MPTPEPIHSDANKAFAEPIGTFVFAFGYLEHQLDAAIGALLRIESSRESDAITAQIQSVAAKARLVQQLVKIQTENCQLREEAERVAKEIARINTYRNRLIHGPWNAFFHGNSEEPSWQKLSTDPQNFKTKAFGVKISDIKNNTSAAYKAMTDVGNLAYGLTKVPIGGRTP
ncbi:MAG: hypothetical protein RIM72_08670 [Alphaproteobacteria bacterium]